MIYLLPIILLTVISVIYLLIAGVTAARRGFREHPVRLLLLFLVVSAGGELLHAFWQLLGLFVPLTDVLSLLPIQIILLLAFLYFHLPSGLIFGLFFQQVFFHIDQVPVHCFKGSSLSYRNVKPSIKFP